MRRSTSRQLVVIMFTDMVGYAALVQRDEALALRVLKRHHQLVRGVLPQFGGHEIKTMGDAFLVEFGSALRATECAIAIQQRIHAALTDAPEAERFEIRIGLHLGDIERPGKDVFGDSVNIAARIQAQAPRGGVAMSGLVYEQIRDKLSAPFSFTGRAELKNIERPMALFALDAQAVRALPALTPQAHARRLPRFSKRTLGLIVGGACMLALLTWLALHMSVSHAPVEDATPSVAVLPFANLSSERDSEHFVAGVHDTLLTQLANLGGLKVISRTSVMEYRNAARNLREIGAALGAAHIVEGSVQRSGDKIRVIVQLIEADTDQHLWAETYDRAVADVFAIQSDLAQKIASGVHARLTPGEKARLSTAPTVQAGAYELYLRAMGLEYEDRFGASSLARIQSLLEQALALDADFALAHAALSRCHTYHFDAGHDASPSRLSQALASAQTALRLMPDLPEGHLALGLYYYYGFLDFARALPEIERALELQPSSATAHAYRGFVLRRSGRVEESLLSLARAVQLDPRNPAVIFESAASYAFLHRDADAGRICQQLFQTVPQSGDFRMQCVTYASRRSGTLEPARQLERELSAIQNPGPDLHWIRYELALNEARYDDAQRHLQALSDEDLESWAGALPRDMRLGDLARWRGKKTEALAYYRRALDSMRLRVKPYEQSAALVTNEAFARAVLGMLHAELGEPLAALKEAERARALLPETRDPFYGTSLAEEIAKIHLRLNDPDRALDELERLLVIPSHTHIHDLRLQRQWDGVWEHPRFKLLVQRFATPSP